MSVLPTGTNTIILIVVLLGVLLQEQMPVGRKLNA